MIDDQSLHQLREGSRDGIRPDYTSTINGSSHDEIAESPGADYVSKGWGINDNGEGWSFVNAVNGLVAAGCDQGFQGMEGRKGVSSLRCYYVSVPKIGCALQMSRKEFTIFFFILIIIIR